MNQLLGLAPGAVVGCGGRRYVISHILSLEAILGHNRLAPEVEAIIDSVLRELYLTKQKRSIKCTVDEIRRIFASRELKPPHYNTIRNRVLAISERVRDKERLGYKLARKKHDAFPGQFPGADWPLAVVQIDHTKFDIMLVDDIH